MQETAFQYMSADGHTVIHALKWRQFGVKKINTVLGLKWKS